MEQKPSAHDADSGTDEIQDYLDLLLSKATDHPDAQIIAPLESVRPMAMPRNKITPLNRKSDVLMGQPQELVERRRPKVVTFAEPSELAGLKIPFVPAPVPESLPAAEKPSKAAEPAPAIQKTVKPPVAEKPAEPVPAAPASLEQAPPAEVNLQAPVGETASWCDNGRPVWAQERFEVLLFSVGGLTLAVPLVELGSIYPIEQPLTPLFGQVDWFLGLLSVKGRNLPTVNTAKVVMPERYQDSIADHYAYVISINGCDWALAVDQVDSAITLDPADVRWRSQRSKRPWLAGTVVDHMCALLDVAEMAKMFAGYQRQKR